jgi:AhpD family alkylhydroperoxidase
MFCKVVTNATLYWSYKELTPKNMERISESDLPEGLMQSLLEVERYIAKAPIDKSILQLMRIRVSQINGCAYCLDMHSKEAVYTGESIQRLISVSAWREAPYYTPQERVVLEFAEILTRLEEGVMIDQTHEELLKYYTKQQIAIIALAIAQINSWNRLVKSFAPIPGTYKVQQRFDKIDAAE